MGDPFVNLSWRRLVTLGQRVGEPVRGTDTMWDAGQRIAAKVGYPLKGSDVVDESVTAMNKILDEREQ